VTILKHIDGTGFVPASRAIINEVVLSVCFNMVYQLLVSSYMGTGEGTLRLGISDTDYRRNDGCIRHC
jgi:hypothetical protein